MRGFGEEQNVVSRRLTNIVHREQPHIELRLGGEVFSRGDARAMGPRSRLTLLLATYLGILEMGSSIEIS